MRDWNSIGVWLEWDSRDPQGGEGEGMLELDGVDPVMVFYGITTLERLFLGSSKISLPYGIPGYLQ